jgi:hypothetical protein
MLSQGRISVGSTSMSSLKGLPNRNQNSGMISSFDVTKPKVIPPPTAVTGRRPEHSG